MDPQDRSSRSPTPTPIPLSVRRDVSVQDGAPLDAAAFRRSAPLLTIVICTRNRASQLDGALRALLAIRSRHVWDALIVDNASIDDTAAVIAAMPDPERRLTSVRVDRIGLGAARDAATRAARGTILSFTDDDCYLDPGFVDAVVEVFRERPELGCLAGRILPYDPSDAHLAFDERTVAADTRPYSFARPGLFSGANLSFNREVLKAAGGFDPRLGAGTDYPCEDIDAVAAVLWSGHPARFDPRPIVFHHHRRKECDRSELLAVYDRGRGAYYARYLMMPDSRRAYLAAVMDNVWNTRTPAGLRTLWREGRAGVMFALESRRLGFAVCAACLVLVAIGFASLRTGARMPRRMARRLGRHLPSAHTNPLQTDHVR